MHADMRERMPTGGEVLGAESLGSLRRSLCITTSAINTEARWSIWLESLTEEVASICGLVRRFEQSNLPCGMPKGVSIGQCERGGALDWLCGVQGGGEGIS